MYDVLFISGPISSPVFQSNIIKLHDTAHTNDYTSAKLYHLENILFRCVQFHPYPAVCIADFDMALYEEDKAPSYPGVCGTISYLPPEAIRAFDNPALRYRRKCGDRWSAGVILFILISGFHPFHCIYLEATKNKILAGLNDSHHLVSTLCHPNPSSRFTAKQALQHRWFKDIGALRSRFRVCSV
ncbi:kinase-like domain-containing protein [Mycena olivaceomarginata]|nr:kinase-like domain-containing protein [Mycena olivaceomarginata]